MAPALIGHVAEHAHEAEQDDEQDDMPAGQAGNWSFLRTRGQATPPAGRPGWGRRTRR